MLDHSKFEATAKFEKETSLSSMADSSYVILDYNILLLA
jgi:hypothetical protein